MGVEVFCMTQYARRLRELREDRDLTQSDIARVLSCSQQAYSLYEAGARQIPIEQLIKLADFYDVSLDYICGRTDRI